MDLARTPWVDRLFDRFLERVARAAPDPKWVPVLTDKKPVRVAEYGCGHYGCALPTSDPAVVIKVTTDASEAAFAVAAMTQSEQPEGVVRYYKALGVPGQTFRNRPVFVLWRQAAFKVGAGAVFTPRGADGYESRSLNEFYNQLYLYKGMAHSAREVILRAADAHRRWDLLEKAKTYEEWASEFIESTIDQSRVGAVHGAQRVAASFRLLEILEMEMENTPSADLVGGALAHYRAMGLLLADVHANNIGHVSYEDRPLSGIIIVDPGHAVVIDRKWESIDVPDLPE